MASGIKVTIGPKDLSIVLAHLMRHKAPIMITGRPGIGKSEIVEQASKDANAELIISHPVVSDPTDYKGLPFGNAKEANFVPFAELRKLINAQRPTVFFLDDLGQASPAVQAAAMQLILARRINGHKVSDDVTFVAATNRRKDKAGVVGILEPVKSRFSIFELEPTLNDWVDWALTKDWIPLVLINACRWKPEWIREWSPAQRGAIENSPCPRNIVEVAKMMNIPELTGRLRYKVFASRLGSGPATELNAFLDVYNKLPSMKSIIKDPNGALIPHGADAKYAMVGALVEHSNENTFEPIVRYLNRLSAEYSIFYMKDVSKRKRELQGTPTFINWAHRHKEVLL